MNLNHLKKKNNSAIHHLDNVISFTKLMISTDQSVNFNYIFKPNRY